MTHTNNDTEGWRERFDRQFDSRFNPRGYQQKTHAYMPVEALKSFIASEIARARNEALEEAAKAVDDTKKLERPYSVKHENGIQINEPIWGQWNEAIKVAARSVRSLKSPKI